MVCKCQPFAFVTSLFTKTASDFLIKSVALSPLVSKKEFTIISFLEFVFFLTSLTPFTYRYITRIRFGSTLLSRVSVLRRWRLWCFWLRRHMTTIYWRTVCF